VKLYLVTRKDLNPGSRAAQLCHALRQFTSEHEDVDREWYEKSNTLVLLEVPEEIDLLRLSVRATENGIPCSLFREPDLNDAATALAIGPSGRLLVRRLPLALREQPNA
jgi:peptidyl-tRNA hydrolase